MTNAEQLDGQGGRVDSSGTQRTSARLAGGFAEHPRRHREAPARASRLVAALKLLLPAAALSLIALVIVWPQLLPDHKDISIGDTRITVSDIDNLRVTAPRLVGVDDEARPFEVTAAAASQKPDNPSLVNLKEPQADMVLEDGKWVTVNAAEGLFDKTARMIDLDGGVVIYHDDGYEMSTRWATIDMATRSVISEAAVTAHGPTGIITSEGFQLMDGGQRVIFTGKAKLILRAGGS